MSRKIVILRGVIFASSFTNNYYITKFSEFQVLFTKFIEFYVLHNERKVFLCIIYRILLNVISHEISHEIPCQSDRGFFHIFFQKLNDQLSKAHAF